MTTPPVTARRIQIAKDFGLHNVEAAAIACREAGLPFFVACALLEQESHGKNIYGHDKGGVFSTNGTSVTIFGQKYAAGSDIPVTGRNFPLFLVRVMNGGLSNGVGGGQVTYAGKLTNGHRDGGYFRQMAERGLRPWVPAESMQFSFELFQENLEAFDSLLKAAAVYNGGPTPDADAWQYGREVVTKVAAWKKRLGI